MINKYKSLIPLGIAMCFNCYALDVEYDSNSTPNSPSSNPLLNNNAWFGPTDGSYRNNNISISSNAPGLNADIIGAINKSNFSVTDNYLSIGANSSVNTAIAAFSNNKNNVLYNSLSIDGKANNIISGFSKAGRASSNSLYVNEKAIVNDYAIGAYSESSSVSYNDTHIYGQVNTVYGAIGKLDAIGNELNFASTAKANDAVGARSMQADVSSSYVSVQSGANITNSLTVAYADKGNAYYNYANIDGNIKNLFFIKSPNAQAYENTIEIHNNANIGSFVAIEANDSYKNYINIYDGALIGDAKVIKATHDSSGNLINIFTTLGSLEAIIAPNAYNNILHLQQGSNIGDLSFITNSINSNYNLLYADGSIDNLQGIKSTTAKFNSFNINNTIKNVDYFISADESISNYLVLNSTIDSSFSFSIANNNSSYNLVRLLNKAIVNGDLTISKAQGISSFNIAHINGQINGNLILSDAKENKNNSLILTNSTVGKNVYLSKGSLSGNNYLSLVGKNDIKGDIIGSDSFEKNANNTLSIYGNSSVNNIKNINSIYIDLKNSNKQNASLYITDKNVDPTTNASLDLSGVKIVISGFSVTPEDTLHLIYSQNGIHTDDSTSVIGDNTFIFDKWTPSEEQYFTHELSLSDMVHQRYINEQSLNIISFLNLDKYLIAKNTMDINSYNYQDGLNVNVIGSNNTYKLANNIDTNSYGVNIGYKYLIAPKLSTSVGLSYINTDANINNSNYNLNAKYDYVDANVLFSYTSSLATISPFISLGYLYEDHDHSYYQSSDNAHISYGSYVINYGLKVDKSISLDQNLTTNASLIAQGNYLQAGDFSFNNNTSDSASFSGKKSYSIKAIIDNTFRLNELYRLNLSASYQILFNQKSSYQIQGFDLQDINTNMNILTLSAALGYKYHDTNLNLALDANLLDISGLQYMLKLNYGF